jgi:hypothetical protein
MLVVVIDTAAAPNGGWGASSYSRWCDPVIGLATGVAESVLVLRGQVGQRDVLDEE